MHLQYTTKINDNVYSIANDILDSDWMDVFLYGDETESRLRILIDGITFWIDICGTLPSQVEDREFSITAL